MKIKLIATISLLLAGLLTGSCSPTPDFDTKLGSMVKPYRFSIAGWESRAILHEVNQWTFSKQEKIDNEVYVVRQYFSLLQRIKALKSEIEATNTGGEQANLASLAAELKA